MMHFLELKLPPLLLLCLSIGGVKGLSLILPTTTDGAWFWIAASVLVGGVGLLCLGLGVYTFRQMQTTVSPMTPSDTTMLVTQGIYRMTRNPMYLGFTLLLLGAVLYWQAHYGLFVVVFFMGYIQHFQIVPEERALLALFGQEYENYQRRVRRWV